MTILGLLIWKFFFVAQSWWATFFHFIGPPHFEIRIVSALVGRRPILKKKELKSGHDKKEANWKQREIRNTTCFFVSFANFPKSRKRGTSTISISSKQQQHTWRHHTVLCRLAHHYYAQQKQKGFSRSFFSKGFLLVSAFSGPHGMEATRFSQQKKNIDKTEWQHDRTAERKNLISNTHYTA